ncbi:DNA-binding response regulator [bacterium]|nr:MAG: DNA-binding response regulator [bacterium]
MTIRIALAEDQKFLAVAIQQKIALFPGDLEFVFHAPDGHELLEKLAEHDDIDAVLMDIEMPGMDGIEATEQVCQHHPAVKVIMFTVFDDETRIFQAIQAGAKGYMLKDEPPEVLRAAIVDIMDGGAPMSSSIASKALKLLRDPSRAVASADAADFNLTAREIEVLDHLSQGLDYREIAEVLIVAPGTVRKHIENIYRKLQVNNKMRAVKKASRHGLI